MVRAVLALLLIVLGISSSALIDELDRNSVATLLTFILERPWLYVGWEYRLTSHNSETEHPLSDLRLARQGRGTLINRLPENLRSFELRLTLDNSVNVQITDFYQSDAERRGSSTLLDPKHPLQVDATFLFNETTMLFTLANGEELVLTTAPIIYED